MSPGFSNQVGQQSCHIFCNCFIVNTAHIAAGKDNDVQSIEQILIQSKLSS